MNASMFWEGLLPARFRRDHRLGRSASAPRFGLATLAAGRLQEMPILVIGKDRWFRDRILIPSLQALRFANIRAVETVTLAQRELSRSPEPGILIYDTPPDYLAGDKAVAELTRGRSLSLVLLRDDAAASTAVTDEADLVIFKRGTTMLDTVRAIEDVARQCFSTQRRRRADARASHWESTGIRNRSRDVRQQGRDWGQRDALGRSQNGRSQSGRADAPAPRGAGLQPRSKGS